MEDELKEKGLEAGGIFLEKGGRPERRQMKGEWIYKLFGCIPGRPETGWLGTEREGPGIIPRLLHCTDRGDMGEEQV